MQQRASTPSTGRSPRRPWAGLLSTLLLLAAVGFAAAAGYFYYVDKEHPTGPVRAESTPGKNELASVVDAFKHQQLNTDIGRYTATCDQLDQPGQVIKVGDTEAYVFIYPNGDASSAIAEREADAADLNPDTLKLTARKADRPLNEGKDVHVFQHSNVIVILVGGDDATVTKVQNAVDALP